VMNLRVPKMRGISWLAAEPVSFSRRTLLHGVSNQGYNDGGANGAAAHGRRGQGATKWIFEIQQYDFLFSTIERNKRNLNK